MSNIIIDTYRDQLETEMHRQCAVFCTMGTSVESPRWINVEKVFKDEYGCTYLKFKSTQVSRIFFHIEISEAHYNALSRMLLVDFLWDDFKQFRTNFLRENYPTIEQYGITRG